MFAFTACSAPLAVISAGLGTTFRGFGLRELWRNERTLSEYSCGVRLARRTQVIVAVWVVGFAMGTMTHIIDLAADGIGVYAGFPELARVFWISLTVLDPLVLVLLFARLRAAAPLAVLVMVADLAVNWSVFFAVGGLSVFGVFTQSLFGAFAFCTAVHVWRTCRRDPVGRVVSGVCARLALLRKER
ncbi:hypothetical protein EDF60_1463 [Leucobacter luti]|nr:hypothetical protein EDF60_1463 [Leucobacter luti]